MSVTRLNTLENINSALAMVRNNQHVRPEHFYNTILLDTIKVPSEEYIHTQFATKTVTIDPAYQKVVLTRLGSWTAHTEVLKEGIPPRPDQTRSESIEFGYTQFGRFAYYTDQIRTDVLQDFVAHYTKQLADLANATIDKYAREKLLSAPGMYFAGAASSIEELLPGDIITIADLRLLTLRFQRLFINPINGNYNYICSPEFIYDLLDDEYIQQYMSINQSTFGMFESGKPVELFKIRFIETRFDENLAPDLDHPGEYIDSSGNYWLRLVSGKYVFSVKAGAEVVKDNEKDVTFTAGDDAELAIRATLKEYYYRDGSAIENRIYWKLNPSGASSGNVASIYELVGGEYKKVVLDATTTTSGSKIKNADFLSLLADAQELPINRGILTGMNGLVRVIVDGQGTAEIITKELGSAGTSDPLNQLSSVGFKLRGVGFGFERPEAVIITYSVPNNALYTMGLSSLAILGDPKTSVQERGHIVKDGTNDEYFATAWVTSTNYKAGDRVSNSNNQYVVLVDHTSGTFATDLGAGKLVMLGKVLVTNPQDLEIGKEPESKPKEKLNK